MNREYKSNIYSKNYRIIFNFYHYTEKTNYICRVFTGIVIKNKYDKT